MKDNHDKVTRSLPLAKRGRKPKMASGAMTPAERKRAERFRKQQQGYKLIWLSLAEQAVIEKMRSDAEQSKTEK